VVFRDLLARESRAPSWRNLLAILRKLEERGEIRGGRFVAGFIGEEFALPEAVEALRAVRKSKEGTEEVLVSASDPLNLAGILTPGGRVSPTPASSSPTGMESPPPQESWGRSGASQAAAKGWTRRSGSSGFVCAAKDLGPNRRGQTE